MSNVVIDDSSVLNLFNELNESKRLNILLTALKKAAWLLADKTKTNLKTRLGRGATSMLGGVKVKTDKAYTETSVNIMGDYRLKWFEKGTKIRKTKGHRRDGYGRRLKRTGKGGNRGAIKPLYFFRDARQSDIDDTIFNSITESLKRIL